MRAVSRFAHVCGRPFRTAAGFVRAVRLEQSAFTRYGQIGRWARWRTGASAVVAVAGHRRRALADMSAVCLLDPTPMGRLALVAVTLLCMFGLSCVAPLAALVVAAGTVALLCPGPAGWRQRPGRRRLGRVRPAGEYVYVHWLASSGRGAGARLLEAVAAEASAKGQALVLDACNPRLISYYGGLGFLVLATAGSRPGAAPTMARMGLRGPLRCTEP